MSDTATHSETTRDDEPPRNPAVAFGRDLLTRVQDHDVSGMAAELAYRFTLAIFPFGLFLAALGAFVAGWLGLDNPTDEIIAGLGDNLPPELAGAIRPELEQVIGTRRLGLVSLGGVLALWAATSGTMTVIKAMNRAYDVPEARPLVPRYLMGIGLTLAGGIAIIGAFVTIVGGAVLTEEIATQIGATDRAWEVITLLRWPVVFAVLVLGTAFLYRVGPNMRPAWRSALIGGAVFAAGWLVATLGFSLYVANVADYGATYGALGGVIVLLIWLYLTGFILMLGAEVAAQLTQRTEPGRLAVQRASAEAELARRETDGRTTSPTG